MRERRADLVVVGAGIVGLAHAYHASRAGYEVLVVDRDELAVGASVRNFGHICTTAQAGRILELARPAREDWIEAGADAGFPVLQCGTTVVARSAAELAVLEQFAVARPGEAELLDPAEARQRLGFSPAGLTGAASLPLDLRVDAPTAIPALARLLAERGVGFLRRTNVLDVGEECVFTNRGRIRADRVVVAVGHDVDRLLPGLAEEAEVRRCRLRMLEVEAPGGIRVDPAVLTGTSMLRYEGLAAQPAASLVREEVAASAPRLLEAGVNLMLTQRPDGRLVLGDTHAYGVTETPFEDEADDVLLLSEFERLLGSPLTVRRRWRGVYASSPLDPFLVAEPIPGVTVAAVTTGVGMTTAFGLARTVLAEELVTG
ncbi:TIGR03364 family FAD-dependent oxidoreductase [Amnibacterium sp. CER49]|uniref:TIGR03364 family FAD-dependent oxidoreductase n=1 Tax=Amnibacterium sp. CER49 TaxID=3039161 RepID=UPI00244AB6C7|nr:TIGR03364 family FAD-dependent oxidoreductase [Amnibacterium sp. CER49]MDH2442833.1 TIGR03364 family FAD-dependent oxidoreductase [Amnibacterium sp. CER49]